MRVAAVGGLCLLTLVFGAGCTAITAREAERRSAGWRPLPATETAAVGELERDVSGLPEPQRTAVAAALGLLGTSEHKLDCSGLARRAYAAAGVELPRTVREQIEVGEPVPPQDLQPGDLVFFAFNHRAADHVGLYAGRGMMVHVSRSAGCVQLASLRSPSLAAAQVAARRPGEPRRTAGPSS